jgi:hypothetical protein
VITWALLNQSKTINITRDRGFYKNLLDSPIPEIRVATSLALISSGIEPLTLGNKEILQASLLLNEVHLQAGHETRLVELLARNIVESKASSLSGDEIRLVAAPLLHLLQRLTRLSPEFSKTLLSADSQTFDRFCISLLKAINEARTQVADRVVLDKDSRVLVGLHYECLFSHTLLQQLFSNLDIKQIKFVKAGKLQNGSSGPYGREDKTFPDSTSRKNFLKRLEEIKSPTPKQVYLEELQKLARDKSSPALVWNMMHGSPHQSWFYHGQAGEKVPEELRDRRAVSDIEVVEALVDPSDLAKGAIDLSHITFICDACKQYTFAEGILDGIDRIAYQHSADVNGYPTFVTLSQPYMYGTLFCTVVKDVPEPGDQSGLPPDGIEFGMTLFGPFDSELRSLGKRPSIVFRDLFGPDSKALSAHRTAFQDPKRLRAIEEPSPTASNSTSTTSSELQTVKTQDPAIFSPAPLSIEVIKRACEESGLPATGLDTARRSFFIEVSDWKPNSPAGQSQQS